MLWGICGPGNCAQACVNSSGGEPTIFTPSPGVLGPWAGSLCRPHFLPLSTPIGHPVCEMPGDQGNQWLLCPLEGGRFITPGGTFQGGREQPGPLFGLRTLDASRLLPCREVGSLCVMEVWG